MSDQVLVFEGLNEYGQAVVTPEPGTVATPGDLLPSLSDDTSSPSATGIILALSAAALGLIGGAWLFRRYTTRTVTLSYQTGCDACAAMKPKFERARGVLERQGYVVSTRNTRDPITFLPDFPAIPAISVTEGTHGKILYGDALEAFAGEEFEKVTPRNLLGFAQGPLKSPGSLVAKGKV
jgi:hypothetical protein